MARLPAVPEDAAPEEVRAVYRAVKEKYGKLVSPVAVAAHHPEVFRAYTGFEAGLARAGRVEPRLKTLALLKAAALIGCPF
ncbi:MAG: hypothetical protein E6J70_03745 [Deltaproteobacteria bacterium]|nr:MAG: hypothetical protein E6J70_03745 [Deltaproteobacteria bacterium]